MLLQENNKRCWFAEYQATLINCKLINRRLINCRLIFSHKSKKEMKSVSWWRCDIKNSTENWFGGGAMIQPRLWHHKQKIVDQIIKLSHYYPVFFGVKFDWIRNSQIWSDIFDSFHQLEIGFLSKKADLEKKNPL